MYYMSACDLYGYVLCYFVCVYVCTLCVCVCATCFSATYRKCIYYSAASHSEIAIDTMYLYHHQHVTCYSIDWSVLIVNHCLLLLLWTDIYAWLSLSSS